MLTNDDIRSLGFDSGLLRIEGTTVTRWKDGIDLDFPVLAVEKFARAVEKAAYAAAIKACESKKAWSKFLVASRNDTCDECIDAIRALMEQPK